MGILADFVQKIGFARSQCQKANKALSGSCLLMLSSFLVLEERFFKAQKVSLDKVSLYHRSVDTFIFANFSQKLNFINKSCRT